MRWTRIGLVAAVPGFLALLAVAPRIHPAAPGLLIASVMSVVLLGIITAVMGAAIITQQRHS